MFLRLRFGALSTQIHAAMQWTSAPNIGEAPLPQRARSYWKARFSAAHEEIEQILEAERAQLPPWFVVGFGGGVAAWFVLDSQGQWAAFLCLSAALSLLGFAVGKGRAGRALGWFMLAAVLGCALVWARSAWVAQPRLERPHRHRCRRAGRKRRLSRRQTGRAPDAGATGPSDCRRASASRSTRTSFRPALRPVPSSG